MSITNVGGAEQYIYNKCEYLKNHGYKTYVFSSLDRKIIINSFKKYKQLIITELMYSPYFSRSKTIDTVINKIVSLASITESDDVYIESNNIAQALWGELLAKRTNGKNIIFNFQEIHKYSINEKLFLMYKLKRKELLGITKKSVSLMFDRSIPIKEWMTFSAYCNNVVACCDDRFSKMMDNNADISIGSIGRLEKEFIMPMCNELYYLFTINKDVKYNLIFIGGSNTELAEKKIKAKFKNLGNVKVIITGYLYPIPISLINNIDLFISTAGSAFVSYIERKKTVKVHPINAKPVQIMGYTYEDIESHTMYDVLENTTLVEQINIALSLSDNDINYPSKDYSYDDEMLAEFNRQIKMFYTKKEGYYNALSVKPSINPKNVIYFLLSKSIGCSKMHSLLEIIRKIK